MTVVYKALLERFPGRIGPAPPQAGGVTCVKIDAADLRAVSHYLENQHNARIVLVFAEDRVEEEGAFFNYYLVERPNDPGYLMLRVSISPAVARFPSLAPELPALNWQEREIQDWFGLEAEGHPNPRRVA